MKKIGTIGLAMGIAVSSSMASVVEFRNLGGDIGSAKAYVDNVVSAGPISSAASGNDLVYSFSVSGVDLDGGGTANDSMSWDVRFEAFTGSTFSGGELTLGTSAQAVTAPTSEFDVGAGSTTWTANQSIRFSVENVQLTADAGYVATFNGFTALWLTAGNYYLGAGADTTVMTAATGDNTFSPSPSTLVLTAQASERNRNLDGNFTVAIPEPATLGLIAAFGGGILFIRRLLQM